jgi:dTDP-D-glucose 4,6-dehydratase
VQVTTFDALTYAGNLANLAEIEGPRHTFVKVDVRDNDAVVAAMVVGFAYARASYERTVDGVRSASAATIGGGLPLPLVLRPR